MRLLLKNAPDFDAQLSRLLSREAGVSEAIVATVRTICVEVKARGDAALLDYTTRFDRVTYTPETLRVSAAEIAAAHVETALEQALMRAAARIRSYHEKMLPQDVDYVDAEGVRLGAWWKPVDAVGLYVPGGRAAYPSTVLMNAIPAAVAGVTRRVMVVPTPDGVLPPVLLVAARIAGITEIYRIGGAQAIAALAYGTQTIAPVDVIVGPGNAYVAEAKRQLYGVVGIDSIAGPSEILVVADRHTPAAWVAADLLSQAEHDPDASAILITDDVAYAQAVSDAVETALASLPRAAIARESIENHGGIIIVESLKDAPALINRIAPEHLELAVEHPETLLPHIRHAGAIFIGRHTPEAMGDYLAGPSHVLPTSGTARFASGLSVIDCMKRTSFMGFSAEAFASMQKDVAVLAQSEGLGAHALSVTVRS